MDFLLGLNNQSQQHPPLTPLSLLLKSTPFDLEEFWLINVEETIKPECSNFVTPNKIIDLSNDYQ